MATEKTEKKPKKRGGPGNLPPEYIGKPGPGRPKGKRNFWTDFSIAWSRVAEQLRLNQEPEEGVVQIIIHGLKKIAKGDTRLIEHFLDRIYGKVKDEIEMEIKEKLIELDE